MGSTPITAIEINVSCGSITNSCSILLRYVYEIPNQCFYRANLQVEPKRLASVVKPKMPRALEISVYFVGDHLKHKRATEFNTLDKLLSEVF